MNAATPVLETISLFKAFGGVQACQDISFSVGHKDVVGLIGPNGSGKTTVLSILSGFHRPDYGRVIFDGNDLVGRSASAIARAGLCRTWQDPRVIPELSVRENVELGMLAQGQKPSGGKTISGLLEQLELAEHAQQPAGQLPYGMQKLVAFARTLAAEPSLLLLDEPLAGLSEGEAEHLIEFLRQYGRQRSVLIVDHAFGAITRICDRIIVLNSGRKIVEGTPGEVRVHPTVVEVYLGHSTSIGGQKTARRDTREKRAPRLDVSNITAGYGMKRVISRVCLEACEGEAVAVLGVNGAGKSTCLRAMVGLLPLQEGRIRIDGEETARNAARNARAGFMLVPEGAHAFRGLSVLENLEMGGFVLRDSREVEARRRAVLTLFPRLRERLHQDAAVLSGGERQMLAVARALMLSPKVLLLDEPFLGLAPIVIEEVVEQLYRIREETGCVIVLAEQHVSATLQAADSAILLVQGEVRDRIEDTNVDEATDRVTQTLLG